MAVGFDMVWDKAEASLYDPASVNDPQFVHSHFIIRRRPSNDVIQFHDRDVQDADIVCIDQDVETFEAAFDIRI